MADEINATEIVDAYTYIINHHERLIEGAFIRAYQALLDQVFRDNMAQKLGKMLKEFK